MYISHLCYGTEACRFKKYCAKLESSVHEQANVVNTVTHDFFVEIEDIILWHFIVPPMGKCLSGLSQCVYLSNSLRFALLIVS